MDWIMLRSIGTVVSFAVFIGILIWAYARDQRERFNEDALIPFKEEEVTGLGLAPRSHAKEHRP